MLLLTQRLYQKVQLCYVMKVDFLGVGNFTDSYFRFVDSHVAKGKNNYASRMATLHRINRTFIINHTIMNTKKDWINKLTRELQLRNYAASTIKTYTSCLSVILDQYKKYKGYKTVEEIKSFLLTIDNQSYHRSFTATFHHFWGKVLKRPLSLEDIPYPRKTHYLPQILSVQEVYRLFAAVKNPKHLAILKTIYWCGLRISEITNIICRPGLSHIDSDRKTLLVKGSKGYKDRYVPIPAETTQLLRSYYVAYKPQYYLFEGQKGDRYSKRSIQQVFKAAVQAAGINKTVTPHSLRHSRATHLLEANVDIYKIKEFLGHNDIRTTEIYLHLSTKSLVDAFEMADQQIKNLVKSKEWQYELAA